MSKKYYTPTSIPSPSTLPKTSQQFYPQSAYSTYQSHQSYQPHPSPSNGGPALSEQRIKQIFQAQFQELFRDIKDEIVGKVKQIDQQIRDIRGDLEAVASRLGAMSGNTGAGDKKNNINMNASTNSLNSITFNQLQKTERIQNQDDSGSIQNRLRQIQQRLQRLQIQQHQNTLQTKSLKQLQLQSTQAHQNSYSVLHQKLNAQISKLRQSINSFTSNPSLMITNNSGMQANQRPQGRDRSPLFRKSMTGPVVDLGDIIFGDASGGTIGARGQMSTNNAANTVSNPSKPPLPPNSTSTNSNRNVLRTTSQTKIPSINPQQQVKNYYNLSNNQENSQPIVSNKQQAFRYSLPDVNHKSSGSIEDNSNDRNYNSIGGYSYPNNPNAVVSKSQIQNSSNSSTIRTSNSPQYKYSIPKPPTQTLQKIEQKQPQSPSFNPPRQQHQQAQEQSQQTEQQLPNRIKQNLNKNKNSFMRKKSAKKLGGTAGTASIAGTVGTIGVIHQEDVEESLLSNR